jgi:hypothetical protein
MHVSDKIQRPEQALEYFTVLDLDFVASSRQSFSKKRKADIKVIADKSFLDHTIFHRLAFANDIEGEEGRKLSYAPKKNSRQMRLFGNGRLDVGLEEPGEQSDGMEKRDSVMFADGAFCYTTTAGFRLCFENLKTENLFAVMCRTLTQLALHRYAPVHH